MSRPRVFDYNPFMQKLEETAKKFVEASEIQQGYLKLDCFYPHGANSWGSVASRKRMSGGLDGGFDFRNLTEAMQRLDEIQKELKK
jgi:hypothetical protein